LLLRRGARGRGLTTLTYVYTNTGMKAAKTSAFMGGVDGGGGSAKHLEASLQQLLLPSPPLPPPAAAAAGAPLPAAARHMPRSMLAGLLSQGLDAAAAPGVHLLTYRVLAQGKALAPHVLAAPELVERLVAAVLSEVGGAKEEGGKHDGKEDGDDEEEGLEEGGPKESGDVGVWALRALLNTVTDAHLVVLLRYVNFTSFLSQLPNHSLPSVRFNANYLNIVDATFPAFSPPMCRALTKAYTSPTETAPSSPPSSRRSPLPAPGVGFGGRSSCMLEARLCPGWQLAWTLCPSPKCWPPSPPKRTRRASGKRRGMVSWTSSSFYLR